MKPFSYFLICLITFACGTLFLAMHNGWLVILPPHNFFSKNSVLSSAKKISREYVTLYFYHHEKWHTEKTHVLISDDIGQTTKQILQSWLNMLDEEHFTTKKITVQDVLISATQCAYISFDRNPFSREDSTYEKYMWVESLLETLRENKIPLQHVQLLVHHKPLQDYHLDFSHPWPLQGFLQE